MASSGVIVQVPSGAQGRPGCSPGTNPAPRHPPEVGEKSLSPAALLAAHGPRTREAVVGGDHTQLPPCARDQRSDVSEHTLVARGRALPFAWRGAGSPCGRAAPARPFGGALVGMAWPELLQRSLAPRPAHTALAAGGQESWRLRGARPAASRARALAGEEQEMRWRLSGWGRRCRRGKVQNTNQQQVPPKGR